MLLLKNIRAQLIFSFSNIKRKRNGKLTSQLKHFQILFFSGFKLSVKLQNTFKGSLRSGIILNRILSNPSMSSNQLIQLIYHLNPNTNVSDGTTLLLLKKINEQMNKDKQQFKKSVENLLEEGIMKKLIGLIENVSSILYYNSDKLICFFVIKIIQMGQLQSDLDFESSCQFLIQRGIYTNQILEKYLKKLENPIDISTIVKHASKSIDKIFQIRNRIKSFYSLYKLNNKDIKKRLSFQLYQSYIDDYLKLISDQEMLYFINQSNAIDHIFITQFIQASRIVPKIKIKYLQIFKTILNRENKRYHCGWIKEQIYEVIVKMFNKSEAPQVIEILKLFEHSLVISRQFQNSQQVAFQLCKSFGFRSEFLLSCNFLPNSEKKNQNKQKQKYLLTKKILYLQSCKILYNLIQDDYKDGNKEIRKIEFAQNCQILMSLFNPKERQQYLYFFDSVIYLARKQKERCFGINQKPSQKYKMQEQAENDFKKSNVIISFPQKLDLKSYYSHFSIQTGVVRLSYFLQISTLYIQLTRGNFFKSPFEFLVKDQQMIKNKICFPNILKSLCQMFELAQKFSLQFKNDKQLIDLYYFIQNARNSFSNGFASLQPQPLVKDYNVFNPVSFSLRMNPYITGEIQNNFQLNDENIKYNLLNDTYAIVKFFPTKLKQILRQKMKLISLQNPKLQISQDFMKYPYICDFMVRKGNVIFGVILWQDKSTLSKKIIQNSIQYFKKQHYIILMIKNEEDIPRIIKTIMQ